MNNYFDSATSVITVPGVLTVDKSIVDPPDARVTIGQELTYHIEVSLIEGTTQNVTLVDNLPAGTVFVPDSVVVLSTVPEIVFGTETQTYNPVANTLTISWDSVTIPGSPNPGTGIDTGSFALEYDVRVLNVAANQSGTPLPNTVTATAEAGLTDTDNAVDLLLGQILTLTISGRATNSVGPGETITNAATVTYTSINDGPGPLSTEGERNGSGLPDPTALNNYFDSAEVAITVPGALSVNKAIVDPPNAQVSIGQTLTYRVAVSLIEGTTLNVELVDELPEGTILVPVAPGRMVVVPDILGVEFGPQTEAYNPVTNTLTIDWDSVTIQG